MFRRTVASVFLLTVAAAFAERLPIRVYTTADGLASINLNCLVRDSRGFLWFCTSEGLSRFDGYTFANYTFSGDATPRPDVGQAAVDFLETRTGDLWALAPRALCRFNNLPASVHALSECYQTPSVLDSSVVRIAEAPDGNIWLLLTRGLFRFLCDSRRFELVNLGHEGLWTNLMPDSDGSLWLGGEKALAHRLQDGHLDLFSEAEGMPVNAYHYFRVSGMLRDRGHRLWVGTWQGLCLMAGHPQPGSRAVEQVYTTRDGLPGDVVFDILQAHDGKMWVAGEKGLSEWIPSDGAGGRFRSYTAQRGFNLYGVDGPALAELAEDSSGGLWMSGPIRIARHGFISYGTQDGLDSNDIKAVFEDRDGRLIAISADPRPRHLNVFNGERFQAILPRLPASIPYFTWGQSQIHFQDHTGAWWVAADGGLCRYPKVRRVEDLANTLPERIYTKRDGLPGVDIFRLFEDSHGDVWISPIGSDLSRWSRSTGRIEVFRLVENGLVLGGPIAFAEDHAGSLWMSFYRRDLARYRNGRFEIFTTADGLPAEPLPALFVDHAGRLWIASRTRGLIRVDNPSAERPQFRFYGLDAGLSSIQISCIVEDRFGRIYAGSPHGIDQLEPDTGRVRHYGEASGLLSPGRLAAAYRDRDGNLWFGGETLAKFVPEPEDPHRAPPPIRITRIRARGGLITTSELGQSKVDGIRLRSAENAIQIEFASLSFDVAENIRFQYKLEGSRQDWSAPTQLRTVDYASLSSGSYRFLVRAINAEGTASAAPASVAFAILPPFWQRWWFMGLTAAGCSLVIFGAHRYRLRQMLELERVRTRIATDLHDDIGSSLTQIAILSEVARRNGKGHAGDGAEPLERIADLSRGLVDSMSEIVWAINSQRDHLSDLEHRMRRFAADVLSPRDIDLELEVPEPSDDIPLRAEVRRQVFLIFKECIHNALRHSGCRRVQVVLEYHGHHLLLRLSDDGMGFAAAGSENGHGLASMRQRAAEIGGELQITSELGNGTTVTLKVPLLGKPARVPRPT
jgi:signal transduction histidine kinase/ligand-binding sensor domain-containing protein